MTPKTRPTSRRSEDWGIDLRPDIYSRARLRLTVFYVLIRAAILAFFSAILYFWIVRDMHLNIARQVSDPVQQILLLARATNGLQLKIIVIDICVLICSGFVGYALSGVELRPIRKSLDEQILFSSQTSHELRTPLAIIKTENELALRNSGASIEELKDVLRSTVDDVGRMTAIVADLLALSRGEDAAHGQWDQALDLADAAAKICTRMRPLADAKGITFACDAGPAAFAAIDEAGMEMVLANLIQNAFNYTPRGGKVTVSVARRDSRPALIVSDTGVGISQKDLPHVFEPFYKGHHDGDGYTQGSGLGLAIVKKTVRDFHGKIHVESQVGKGTTMTVMFKERQPVTASQETT